MDQFARNGLNVQTEVTLNSCTGTVCRTDAVITGTPGQTTTPVPDGFNAFDLDGNQLSTIPLGSNNQGVAIIEIKTGRAENSTGQNINYNEIKDGTVTGSGNNARTARLRGLVPSDTPVVILRPK